MEKKILETVKTEMKEIERNGSVDMEKISHIVSHLNELNPEVAKELLAQYPVFAGVLKEAVGQYGNMINSILSGNGKNMDNFYKILEKECDGTDNARRYLYGLSSKSMEIYNSIMKNPNASESLILEAATKQLEVLKIYAEFEKMEFEKEKEIRNSASQKDSENKKWLWEVAKVAGTVALSVATVSGLFFISVKTPKIPTPRL